jgi:hypothetical protein
MRSWSKWKIFSRRMKSSSSVGPRVPSRRLFWLSEIRVPWLVVRYALASVLPAGTCWCVSPPPARGLFGLLDFADGFDAGVRAIEMTLREQRVI